jgi:excisionase family DNA binding protein
MYVWTTVREASCMNTHGEKLPLAVDTREAARLLSVSPRTIQNYIAARLLPARKIGRRTVISVRALENFMRTDQPSPVITRVERGADRDAR